jgi:hypothetical protein
MVIIVVTCQQCLFAAVCYAKRLSFSSVAAIEACHNFIRKSTISSMLRKKLALGYKVKN